MIEGAKKVLYEDIDFLTSLNIGVVPLSKNNGNIRDVKTGSNSKSDFKPTLPINKTLYNKQILKNAINNDIIGFYIETGKRSNIMIVDYDNKQTTNPDFIKKLQALETLTIKTPAGGFHFVFKYNDKYKTNSIGIFNNIDIRTDGAITFFGIREDGEYKIIDKTKDAKASASAIKELPNEIIKELKSYKKSEKPDSTEGTRNLVIDNTNLNDNIDIAKGLNITEKELYRLLLDLPNKYLNEYSEWLEYTYILKKYDFGKVWDRWSKNSPKYDKNNNIKIFNSLDTSKEYRDINIIIKTLNKTNKYKDNKLNNIEKIFNIYKPMKSENEGLITNKINGFLSDDIYKDGKDCIIWSGLGTGKSTSVKNYIKNTNKKVITITTLEKTVNSLYNDFNREHLDCIYYKDLDPKELKALAEKKQEERILKGHIDNMYMTDEEKHYDEAISQIKKNINKQSIFITIDSLLNLKNFNINYCEYVIFIDEIHSLIKYLLTCENLKNKRKPLFSYFMNILKSANQIIMADGDICNNTIRLLQILKRNDFKFVKNEMKKYDGVRCYREENFLSLINKMKDDIKNNIYFTCACNTKDTANKIKLLLKDSIKDPKDLLIYTADEGDKIYNINVDWLNKYVIYSPSIVCGLDFNPPMPYNTYSIIEGDTTLNPEEIGQQIARNRNIKELCIYINKISNIKKYNNINDVKKAVEYGTNAYKEAFADLVDTQTSEDGTNIDYKENIFTELLFELELQNDILKSSYYYNLFEILKNKGFKVERNILKSKSLEKAERDKLNIEIKENKEVLLDKYINDELDENNKYQHYLNRIIKNLDIPEEKKEDLKNFSNILIDDKAILNHLNIRLLTTKPDLLKLLNREDLETEYLEILYRDKKPLTLILNEIFNDYLKNDINIFNYQYKHDEPFLSDVIDIKQYHYDYIKSVIRTKKAKPQTKGDLLHLLNTVIKSLFGRDIIKAKEVKITQDNNRIKKYNYEFNQDLFKNHLDLFKISLDNNKKYKYVNILEDIKNTYYNNINISDEDYKKYREYLLTKNEDIEKNHVKNTKEQMKTDKVFEKLIKKTETTAKKDTKKAQKKDTNKTEKTEDKEIKEHFTKGLEEIKRRGEEQRKQDPEAFKIIDEYRKQRDEKSKKKTTVFIDDDYNKATPLILRLKEVIKANHERWDAENK